MTAETDNQNDKSESQGSPAIELLVVATTWGVGSGLGQLALMPLGLENWALWFGLVLGATAQSTMYFHRKTGPFVR